MRSSWDDYFMRITAEVATRSTCNRLHVGCLIVRDNQIVVTGYNGSLRKADHCDDVGHLMEDGHCVRTVHAEANAITQAARRGVAVDGSTVYVTAAPCFNCFKILVNAGCVRVLFRDLYRRDSNTFAFATYYGISISQHLQQVDL